MRINLKMLALAAATVCSAAAIGQAEPAKLRAPAGATVEPSGFPTILSAPVPDYGQAPAQGPRARNEADWLWRDQGLSIGEARKRMAALVALQPEFERLQNRLREKEAGNYTDARIVHLPDWAYVLYFKRDPDATLVRYTHNPRFKAAKARYTREELDALVKPWAERFGRAGIIGGYGSDATYGTAEFMMSVTEQEYREIAAKAGWEAVPPPIKLGFARKLAIPAVDPRAAPFLRSFANDTRATTIQLEGGFTGRLVVRDGCIRSVGIKGNGAPGALAYFHKETGVGLDEQGYLVLIDRITGKPKGRLGEMFSWAGPNSIRPDMPGLAELKARCGDGPVHHVGNPESKAAFDARYSRR